MNMYWIILLNKRIVTMGVRLNYGAYFFRIPQRALANTFSMNAVWSDYGEMFIKYLFYSDEIY